MARSSRRLEYADWRSDSVAFLCQQGTNFVVNGSLILAFFYLVVLVRP